MRIKNQNDVRDRARIYGLCGRPCVIVLMKIIRMANGRVSVYILVIVYYIYVCVYAACVCARRHFCVLILVFPTAFFPPSHSHVVGRPVVHRGTERRRARSSGRPYTYRLSSNYFFEHFVIFFSYSNSRRYCRAQDHDTRRLRITGLRIRLTPHDLQYARIQHVII